MTQVINEPTHFTESSQSLIDIFLVSSTCEVIGVGEPFLAQNLVSIYNTFCQALDVGKEVRAVFCDISKAFDRVWHRGLLYKLKLTGVADQLLDWFCDYLSERKQRVGFTFLFLLSNFYRLEVVINILPVTEFFAFRYRKICVPLGRQISRQMAKVLCLIVIFVAVLISWPAPVLYGIATVNTSDPNITGTRCYTEDKELYDTYQGFFNGLLILVVMICFFVLVVLYTLTWRAIVKQSRLNQPKINERPQRSLYKEEGIPNDTINEFPDPDALSENTTNEDTTMKIEIFMIENSNEVSNSEKAKNKRKQERSRKTTVIFLVITAVFFISYFPHLALKLVTFTNKDFVSQLSYTGKVVYNTFIWCFFINNTINSFVYGFFDLRFRSEIISIYTELFNLARRCVGV
ncbi:uncharacterized protein LOC132714232 [Ruditapes philippinarum]|uniref:uncharacterized protein LOC132714232 n=1 Tax=Ruditapes philippinarum TaxID=129788 RepID=UPI00295AD3FA|nr:uncharacterized protein LOC132714232 [Ruditapes philippinarum]